jgi:hypothetical protein
VGAFGDQHPVVMGVPPSLRPVQVEVDAGGGIRTQRRAAAPSEVVTVDGL